MSLQGYGGVAKGTIQQPDMSPEAKLLSQLVARLAPPQLYIPTRFTNLAVGGNPNPQNGGVELNGSTINAVIGSLTAGQVGVWFGSSADLTQPPDLIFVAGGGSVYVPIPATSNYDRMIIQNNGTVVASGAVIALCY